MGVDKLVPYELWIKAYYPSRVLHLFHVHDDGHPHDGVGGGVVAKILRTYFKPPLPHQ